MRPTRQRGHSFYEKEEDENETSPIKSSPGRNKSTGSAGKGSSTPNSVDSYDIFAADSSSRDSTEGESFSVSSSSSGSQSEGGISPRSSDDIAEEDLAFSRGRSRSRSICGAPDIPEGSGVVKVDPANLPIPSKGIGELKEVAPMPKSGPLAQHEIQVLKKVRMSPDGASIPPKGFF